MARGKSRSDRIENVVADAQTLASKGVKEIVLTGINLGDFGKSEEGGKKHTENFFELLKALEQETNMPRYRISSIEPNLLTNEIIEFVAKSKRIMPHFHIPLQSGSDAVLKLMQRRYTRDLYQERVDLIKKIMPHACIGVDVIVGSPGETEDYFKESLEFVHALDIAYLHVFTYSERAATKALTIKPIVPMQERHERNKILRNLSYQKLQYFTESQRGATRKVLFESPKVNKENEGMLMLEGFTDNYIKVETPHRAEWSNQIIDWKLL
jgi:threonylcarbamoyladenosine tRNA methylthiotransferase MtaB